MKSFLIISLLILSSCELIVIGEVQEEDVIQVNRKSAIGSIMLFKMELDSNNIPAAADILASPNGYKLLAVNRVEEYDELYRIRNIIDKRPITLVETDSITDDQFKLKVEFGYLKEFSFLASKIDSSWYITSYEQMVESRE